MVLRARESIGCHNHVKVVRVLPVPTKVQKLGPVERSVRASSAVAKSSRAVKREDDRRRAKAQAVETILTAFYGPRVWTEGVYITDLVGALVATILSQNTSDLNSGRALSSLKPAFPGGLGGCRTAPVESSGGFDSGRAASRISRHLPRIQVVLDCIHDQFGRTNLDHIRDWDDDAIRDLLRSFPGVGAKTRRAS